MNANEENNNFDINEWVKKTILKNLKKTLHPAIRKAAYDYYPELKDIENRDFTPLKWQDFYKITNFMHAINVELVLCLGNRTLNIWEQSEKEKQTEKKEADEELNNILIRVFQFPKKES